MRDVAAAIEAEGLTTDLAAAVAMKLPTGLGGSVQQGIVDAARAMTAVGVPAPVQVRVFWRAFGVGVGGGGGAGFDPGVPPPEPCPWCCGTGSHGGWCPGPWLRLGPKPWTG